MTCTDALVLFLYGLIFLIGLVVGYLVTEIVRR